MTKKKIQSKTKTVVKQETDESLQTQEKQMPITVAVQKNKSVKKDEKEKPQKINHNYFSKALDFLHF